MRAGQPLKSICAIIVTNLVSIVAIMYEERSLRHSTALTSKQIGAGKFIQQGKQYMSKHYMSK